MISRRARMKGEAGEAELSLRDLAQISVPSSPYCTFAFPITRRQKERATTPPPLVLIFIPLFVIPAQRSSTSSSLKEKKNRVCRPPSLLPRLPLCQG